MKNNKIIWEYIYIGFVSVTAFILIMWITPYGSGVSPDSTIYIGGAKSLLSGKGFSIDGSPITHYPPLYPLLLAVVGFYENNFVQASRLLNAIIFGINAGMIALAINLATKRNYVASICAVFFFLSSAALLQVHAWAWSEPLFITLSLSCIILLSMYVIQPTISLLVASSLFLGFAIITRYIGIAFLPPALIIVFIGGSNQNIYKRLKNALVWIVLALSPLGIWLTRNIFISEMVTDRKLIFHPISIYGYSKSFISIIINFFAPILLVDSAKLSIFVLLAILLIVLLVIIYKRRQLPINWRRMDITITVSCLLFFLSYPLFLFISISFFDAATPVDTRILSPELSILILGVFSAMWTLSQLLKESIVRWGFLLVIVLSISIKLPDAILFASAIQKDGIGYSARRWQESESIAFISSITSKENIYSNGKDVISFLTGKQVLSIPRKTRTVTMMGNTKFDEEIKSMCENIIENRALLVYLDNITWRWYLPSQTEIETACPLPVLQQFSDGTVYGK